MKLSSGLVAGVLLTIAVPVCAQSLGDLAKKEQERRKTAPPATKTYTNDDLRKMPPPSSPEPGTDPAAKVVDKDAAKAEDPAKPGDPAKAGDAKAEGAKPAEPAKDEAYWRGRITTAREEVRRNEMFRDALQTRIDALSADFAGRDDPYQRATIADDRQKALAELERVKTEIEKLTKQIADIEEEARRAGVPPGWLR
jgi:hypothetical protein